MRLVPEEKSQASLDGPEAFGPLHGTLTLGCLRVVSIVGMSENRIARLLDERSELHEVKVGDWVGENAGRISEITEQRLTIVQIYLGEDGKLIESNRYLFLQSH